MKTAQLTRLASVVCLFPLCVAACLGQDTLVFTKIKKPDRQLFLPTGDFGRSEIFTLRDDSKIEAVLLSISDEGYHLLVEPSERPDSAGRVGLKWWPRSPKKKTRFNRRFFTESRIVPIDSVTRIHVRDFPYEHRKALEGVLLASLYAADLSILVVPLPATLVIVPATFAVSMSTLYILRKRQFRLATKWQLSY